MGPLDHFWPTVAFENVDQTIDPPNEKTPFGPALGVQIMSWFYYLEGLLHSNSSFPIASQHFLDGWPIREFDPQTTDRHCWSRNFLSSQKWILTD